VARDRGSLSKALARLAPVPFLTLSITSDILYPEAQQVALRDAVRAAGGRCDHHVVQNPDGHDGFLLATDEVGRYLGSFLEEIESNG
jgi:homoserine O-acetyltransferase